MVLFDGFCRTDGKRLSLNVEVYLVDHVDSIKLRTNSVTELLSLRCFSTRCISLSMAELFLPPFAPTSTMTRLIAI